jgi:hypothetical protein
MSIYEQEFDTLKPGEAFSFKIPTEAPRYKNLSKADRIALNRLDEADILEALKTPQLPSILTGLVAGYAAAGNIALTNNERNVLLGLDRARLREAMDQTPLPNVLSDLVTGFAEQPRIAIPNSNWFLDSMGGEEMARRVVWN